MLATYRNQRGTQKIKYERANFDVIQRRVSSESQAGKYAFTMGRCGKHQFNQATKLGIINEKQAGVYHKLWYSMNIHHYL